MSKAEDLARRVTFTSNNLHDLEIYKQGFFEGYHQAEKDLELTWENIQKIIWHWENVSVNSHYFNKPVKEAFEEVLRRFNEERNKV